MFSRIRMVICQGVTRYDVVHFMKNLHS